MEVIFIGISGKYSTSCTLSWNHANVKPEFSTDWFPTELMKCNKQMKVLLMEAREKLAMHIWMWTQYKRTKQPFWWDPIEQKEMLLEEESNNDQKSSKVKQILSPNLQPEIYLIWLWSH